MSKALVVKFLFVFIFACFTFFSVGQSVSVTLGRFRSDYLLNLAYGQYFERSKVTGVIGTGTSKTFLQHRLNPRVGIAYCFDLLPNSKFFVGLSSGFYSSWYKLSNKPKSVVSNEELLVGPHFEVGKQWKFVSSVMYGVMTERSSGNLYFSYGYYAKFGMAYHW